MPARFMTLTRDGYTPARDGILTGTMHSATAVGLLVNDRDWIAECETRGWDVARAAWAVVDRWRCIALGTPSEDAPTVAELLAVEDAAASLGLA